MKDRLTALKPGLGPGGNMKEGFSVIACVLDRSGSMMGLADEAIGGFNALLEEQKNEPGDASMTLVQFDHEYEVLCDMVPLADVQPLSRDTYQPRGTTALLDAVARTIDSVGDRLASMDESERPEHVIFVILTDGQENASREITKAQVAERVKRQQDDYNWKFIFLAANQDAFAEAGLMGINQQMVSNFVGNKAGTKTAYAAATYAVSSTRRGNFDPKDKRWDTGSKP